MSFSFWPRTGFTIFLLALSLPLLADSGDEQYADDPVLESWYKQHLAAAQARYAPDQSLRREAEIDVGWYRLMLEPDMVTGSLNGRVELGLNSCLMGLNQLELDFAGSMTVDAVDGNALSFTHTGDQLVLLLDAAADSGDVVEIGIDYHGSPQASGFGSWSLTTHAGTPILSTLSEPYGARSWWPCKDDPSDKADSVDIWITVPDVYTATSNGILADVDTLGSGLRFHWQERYPITTYLVSMAVTNYAHIGDQYVSTQGDTMEVSHYVYPEDLADATEDLNVTVPMLEFFSQLWGEYPFVSQKYGHSEFPWGGAMEHQCNTSYGAVLIRGDHRYDRIVAHEMAHQWWGDMITCSTFNDIWLNEGFATYSEALWVEHVDGSAAYRSFMNSRAFVSDPSGPVYMPPSTFNSNTVYKKGAWLLHMLRGIIGDSAFTDLMRGWYASPYRYSDALVADFVAHCENYTNKDLAGFWQGYLYGMNRPSYQWDAVARSHQGVPMVQLYTKQVQQNTAVFQMHLPFVFESAAPDQLESVYNASETQGYAFVLAQPLEATLLDPDDWVLDYNSRVTLEDQIAQLVFSARFADGSVPLAAEVAYDLSRKLGPATVLLDSTMEQGIGVLEFKQALTDWSPGDTLVLNLHSLSALHPQESLSLELALPDALWQDLGILTMAPQTPPALQIAYLNDEIQLSWTVVPGASAYRLYRFSQPDHSDETLLAETTDLQWTDAAQAGTWLYRVRAVFP